MTEKEDLLEEANHKISVARLLLENDEYGESVSRAYYGMFHAAKALLSQKGSNPKTHAGVSTELGRLYREELDDEILRSFTNIQELREDADYGLTTDIAKDRAMEVVRTADEFVSEAESLLQ